MKYAPILTRSIFIIIFSGTVHQLTVPTSGRTIIIRPLLHARSAIGYAKKTACQSSCRSKKGKQYKEWSAEQEGTSWKPKLRETIDALLPSADSFESFLVKMRQAGYEIKTGKYISFRATGQTRFTRAKTLGADLGAADERAPCARSKPCGLTFTRSRALNVKVRDPNEGIFEGRYPRFLWCAR